MGELTRRTLLRTAAGGYAGLALGGAVPGWARKRAQPLRAGHFASGVAAGFPRRHSAHLWTRVAGADEPGLVGWEVAADPGFDRVLARGRTQVGPHGDFTAKPLVASPRRLAP